MPRRTPGITSSQFEPNHSSHPLSTNDSAAFPWHSSRHFLREEHNHVIDFDIRTWKVYPICHFLRHEVLWRHFDASVFLQLLSSCDAVASSLGGALHGRVRIGRACPPMCAKAGANPGTQLQHHLWTGQSSRADDHHQQHGGKFRFHSRGHNQLRRQLVVDHPKRLWIWSGNALRGHRERQAGCHTG